MRTLTLNRKHILYGMLLVTLGFSKAWFQTAETNNIDFASNGIPSSVNIDVEDQTTHKTVTHTVLVKATPKKDVTKTYDIQEDGQVTTKSADGVEFSFSDNGCDRCIQPILITNKNDLSNALQVITDGLKQQLTAKADKAKQDADGKKADDAHAKAMADCKETDEKDDKGKYVKLTSKDHETELYTCMAKQIEDKDYGDKDDRQIALAKRSALKTLTNKLKTRLNGANSGNIDDIQADVDAINEELGGDDDLTQELRFMNGAVALETQIIPNDARNHNTSDINNKIDFYTHPEKYFTNPYTGQVDQHEVGLAQYWEPEALTEARSALSNADAFAARFFNTSDMRVNNGTASGDRTTRTDVSGLPLPNRLRGRNNFNNNNLFNNRNNFNNNNAFNNRNNFGNNNTFNNRNNFNNNNAFNNGNNFNNNSFNNNNNFNSQPFNSNSFPNSNNF